LITLTTDFGYRDPFVGMMKGVIKVLDPAVEIVDITHGIGAHNIKEAAVVISDSYGYFPGGTVHVVVVDPEVGTKRRPILVMADQHYFIGPDNGVFTEIFNRHGEDAEVTHLTAEHYFLRSEGQTFHGRDVFAPIAAAVSKKVDVTMLGDPITDYVKVDIPVPSIAKDRVRGEVIHVDRFGNAITNIRLADMKKLDKVLVKDMELGLKRSYAAAKDDKPHATINSSGRLEVFIYKNSAAKELDIRPGEKVSVTEPAG
jgi:S-adenosylmethionine hydrolase